MTTIRVTMDVPANKLAALQGFLLDAEAPEVIEPAKAKEPEAVPQVIKAEAPRVEEPAPEEPKAEKTVTRADIRALGVKLSKAGRNAELAEVFSRFGVKNIKDLKEEDFAACHAALEAIL